MKSSLELVYTLLLYVIYSSTSRWFVEETHTRRALPLGAREGGDRERPSERDAQGATAAGDETRETQRGTAKKYGNCYGGSLYYITKQNYKREIQ